MKVLVMILGVYQPSLNCIKISHTCNVHLEFGRYVSSLMVFWEHGIGVQIQTPNHSLDYEEGKQICTPTPVMHPQIWKIGTFAWLWNARR